MAPPQQLAFPPTALRNVAAGLVVGNPVGSSGTRAKALTSAELKAIVEASGISYLPLAGGTLTGPITGTAGLIEQRNGLTAQCLDIFETYTSGTNNGKLRFKATSSGHQIGSARASSGSNRAVEIGHFNSSDAFTSAISVPLSGEVQISRNLIMSGTYPYFGLTASSWSGGTFYFQAGVDSTGTGMGNFTGLINPLGKSFAVVSGNPNTTGRLHLTIDGSTSACVIAGPVTLAPSTSSITLATNGQFSIEMTSNTAGNLVYRGSDGTTRRMALTFY